MKYFRSRMVRSLAAGLAGVALGGSLAAPAQAAGGPGSPTPSAVVVPRPNLPPILWPADLILEQFDVVALSGGRWRLKATLRNGRVGFNGRVYPGGGTLRIGRTSGGTICHEDQVPFPATPDVGQVLASRPIPALAYGQAITLEVVAIGRAIFTAYVFAGVPQPDAPAPTLPESDPNNNSKTVNKLIPRSVSVNTALLNLALGDSLGQFEMLINQLGHIRIPGILNQNFSIPSYSKVVWLPFGPFLVPREWTWYVNDINSTSVELAVQNGGLSMCVNFETNGDEIIGVADAPNANANPLKICVTLPLQYVAWAQYFHYGTPQVTVDANWTLNGPLPDSLLPDLNGKIREFVKSFLMNETIKKRIEFELNQQIRSQLLRGGRILGVTILPSEVRLAIEAGA